MLEYLEFILENSLKLRLIYSEKFKNIIEKMSKTNNMAKTLLKYEDNSDKLSKFTLIDITDKNNLLSFVQSNRIVKDFKGIESDNTLYNNQIVKKSTFDKYKDSKSRTSISTGKLIGKIFKDVILENIKPFELEEFVNLYKATYDNLYGNVDDLIEVSGEDIRHWYNQKNYESIDGQLGNSCMSYEHRVRFLDIYVKNPEVCKLVILKSKDKPGKIRARALLWKTTSEEFYLDRIYSIRDSDIILFENWAKEYDILTYNTYGGDLSVQLKKIDYKTFPYMDTFMVYNPYLNLLKNDESLWPGNDYYLLQNVDGSYTDYNVVWSEIEEEYIDRDGAVLDHNGEWIYRSTSVEINGEYYSEHSDLICYSRWLSKYILSDNSHYSDILNDNLPIDSPGIIRVEGSNDYEYLPKERTDLYFEFNGEYYTNKDWVINPYDRSKVVLLTKSTSNTDLIDLEKELEKELGSENEIKENIFNIINNEKYNKSELIEYISNDKFYLDNIKNVYWPVPEKYLPNPDVVIKFLLYCIFSGNSYIIKVSLDKNDDKEMIEYFDKFTSGVWYNSLVKIIISYSEIFDYKLFNDDYIYKSSIYFRI